MGLLSSIHALKSVKIQESHRYTSKRLTEWGTHTHTKSSVEQSFVINLSIPFFSSSPHSNLRIITIPDLTWIVCFCYCPEQIRAIKMVGSLLLLIRSWFDQ